ncbi:MAG TPA: hypothetical protein VMD75_18600 [Candidatus Binataceae bacterium]|nr:hypothetical protein [Candidatus Binataceae bacterium]
MARFFSQQGENHKLQVSGGKLAAGAEVAAAESSATHKTCRETAESSSMMSADHDETLCVAEAIDMIL